jgi:hypothetical protein
VPLDGALLFLIYQLVQFDQHPVNPYCDGDSSGNLPARHARETEFPENQPFFTYFTVQNRAEAATRSLKNAQVACMIGK